MRVSHDALGRHPSHFAFQEIKLVVALFVSTYAIARVEPDAPLPEFDITRAGFGILPPSGELRVRVRRREPVQLPSAAPAQPSRTSAPVM